MHFSEEWNSLYRFPQGYCLGFLCVVKREKQKNHTVWEIYCIIEGET